MLIAVDIDDTLCDFVGPLAEFNNNHYGTNLKREDFKSYYLRQGLGLSEEDATKRIASFADSCLSELKPFPDAVETIKELSKTNKLVVITSRGEKRRELTKNWVFSNFQDSFSGIYFAHNHYLGIGDKQKHELCDELGADVIIEDTLEYALKCCKNHKVLLYDSPWNQLDNLPDGITRVYSWKDIGRILL